jgi:hypothetical protein
MSQQPAPSSRLTDRLDAIPDACRSILAALDRQACRGGGPVTLTLDVGPDGALRGIEVTARFEPRLDKACDTLATG